MEWTKIERYGVGRSEYWKGVHKNLWEREVRGKKKSMQFPSGRPEGLKKSQIGKKFRNYSGQQITDLEEIIYHFNLDTVQLKIQN